MACAWTSKENRMTAHWTIDAVDGTRTQIAIAFILRPDISTKMAFVNVRCSDVVVNRKVALSSRNVTMLQCNCFSYDIFFFLLYVILANKVENWRKFHHTPRTVRCQQWPIGKCISGAKWMFPLEAEKCFDFVRVRAKKALLRIVMASRDICGHTSHLLMVFTQRPKLIIIRPMARYHSIEHTSDKAIAKVKQSENDESHCNCVG